MPNAKAALLIAAVLAIHTAQAADPANSIAPAAPDGARLFAAHCAMCHQPADLARRLQSAADPAAARVDMAEFLARHGRSDATADGAIIDYLASGTFRWTAAGAGSGPSHGWGRGVVATLGGRIG